jgi:predicted metal-dependent hydrolase
MERFQEKWLIMQKQLSSKGTWKQAVIDADKLLDEALKKRRFPGKSMGERLTKAQRLLSDNESVWYGHKLRNKMESEPNMKLKEADVKQALIGIRQALKDLGALPDGK